MSEAFDPYYKWLGIPPAEQPPNHYRLLGVTLFEADSDVIGNAADQRMAHVRTFQAGRHSDVSQRILNEIAAARVCLLNADKKAEYDRTLQQVSAAPQFPAAVPFPSTPPPVISFGTSAPPPLPLGPTPVFPTVESMIPGAAAPEVTAPPVAWVDNSAPHYHPRPRGTAWLGPAIFAGLLAVGSVVAWLLWQKGLEEQARSAPGGLAAAPAVSASPQPATPPEKAGQTAATPQAPPQTPPKKPKEPTAKPAEPSKPAAVVSSSTSTPPVPAMAKPAPPTPEPVKPEPPKSATSAGQTVPTTARAAFGMPVQRPVPDAGARQAAEGKLATLLSSGTASSLR